MLRIHIEDTAGTYSIPPDNPFFGSLIDKQEIWCFGLRNPFRDSFDRLTGTMYLGDVGQATREEIDVQQASNPGGGEDYGWRVREGFIQNPAYPNDPPPPDATITITITAITATAAPAVPIWSQRRRAAARLSASSAASRSRRSRSFSSLRLVMGRG